MTLSGSFPRTRDRVELLAGCLQFVAFASELLLPDIEMQLIRFKGDQRFAQLGVERIALGVP